MNHQRFNRDRNDESKQNRDPERDLRGHDEERGGYDAAREERPERGGPREDLQGSRGQFGGPSSYPGSWPPGAWRGGFRGEQGYGWQGGGFGFRGEQGSPGGNWGMGSTGGYRGGSVGEYPGGYGSQGGFGGMQGGNWGTGYPGGSGSQTGPHTGRGPKGFQRSDDRIYEDVCQRLEQDGEVDASDIEVNVERGVVTLTGSVDSRQAKRLAEDAVESCPGVRDVQNQIRVSRRNESGSSGSGRGKEGKEEREPREGRDKKTA